MANSENTKLPTMWIAEVISKTKDTVIDPNKEAVWDWPAEVWCTYLDIFNEFTINEAAEIVRYA